MNYNTLNDFELIYYIRSNDDIAEQILYKKYEPLIKSKAKKLYKYTSKFGIEESDLFQEGMVGLAKAIQMFNEQKDNLFATFANTCIDRTMRSFVLQITRQKHKILNESVSIEVATDEGSHDLFAGVLEDNSFNPEIQISLKEEEEELIRNLKKNLTDFEEQVFELRMSYFDYKEIASILDKDPKSIDNAIQRIKAKLKQEIQRNK